MEEQKSKKRAKLGKGSQKEIINIARTTLRNNIELTNIADNKANVLLTLNALMITFSLPLILSNRELLFEYRLLIPLGILAMTNIITIYISTLVLKPSDFQSTKNQRTNGGKYYSPFFFGNYFDFTRAEFGEYLTDALSDEDRVRTFVADDMYYIGTRLVEKMTLIRKAFNIFLLGLTLAIIATFILIMFHFYA